MTTAPTLIASGTRFYSQLDERAFFDWLGLIPCVESYKGEGNGLKIQLKGTPKPEDLRDFLALFSRYKVDLRQMAQFLTEENRQWFCDRRTYWYAGVFGEASRGRAAS